MRAECRCRRGRRFAAFPTKRTRNVVDRGDYNGLHVSLAWRRVLARSARNIGPGRAGLMITPRRGGSHFRSMNFNSAQPFDQPIGGFSVHMFVRETECADDPGMLAVLGGPALEHDVVELVARDGKRVVATSVPRTTRLPRVMANPT